MDDPTSTRLEAFVAAANAKDSPLCMEVGTMRSNRGKPTEHSRWVPRARRWVWLDVQPGLDVTVLGDLERLPFRDRMFDAVVSCSTWEHLRRPWVATNEVGRVLAPGGVVYIQTHQTFPLHFFPGDFFRFSMEALSGLVWDAGLEVVDVGYEFPCQVVSQADPGGRLYPAWLNVDILGRKP